MNKLIEDLIDEIGSNMDQQIDNCIDYPDLRKRFKEILTEQCDMRIVSISKAQEYAEFCVECDRKGLKLLCIEDYIKLY